MKISEFNEKKQKHFDRKFFSLYLNQKKKFKNLNIEYTIFN
jgi:hypothetical protein